MRQKIILMVIVLCLLILFFGLIINSFFLMDKNNDSLKIGVIGVLSGPSANSWGVDTQRGIELGVLDAKELGINIELIVADSESQPSKGISELNRIESINDPDLFIVEASAVASAIKPLVGEINKPIFFTAVAAKDITLGNELLFRNFYMCETESPLLAKSAIQKLNLTKTIVLFQKEPFGESCSTIFIEEYKKLGGEVVVIDNFLVGETDFKTILLKIKDKAFDSIYISGYELAVVSLLEDMKELGVDKKVLSTTLTYSPSIREQVIANSNPFQIYFSGTDFYLGSNKANTFRERFIVKYGNDPSHVAAYSYDSIMVIAYAKKISNEKNIFLEKALLQVEFEGINGFITFDEKREVNNPTYLLTVNENGKVVKIE